MTNRRILLFTERVTSAQDQLLFAAQRLGVELVPIANGDATSIEALLADAFMTSFAKPEMAALEVIQRFRNDDFAAVLAIGEQPSLVAAYASRGLGLPYNHPLAVEASCSRLRQREIFRDCGLPSSWFRAVPIVPAPEPALLGVAYPCILMPLVPAIAAPAVIVRDRQQFFSAIDELNRMLVSKSVVPADATANRTLFIEQFIPGSSMGTNALLTHGQVSCVNFFDLATAGEAVLNDAAPQLVPSRESESIQSAVTAMMQQAVSAIGLTHGPVYGEFRINETGVWPLSISPGYLRSDSVDPRFTIFGSSVDSNSWEELLLKNALS